MNTNPNLRTTSHEATLRTPNYEIPTFMQNKPNFSNNPMNISPFVIDVYEQKTPLRLPAKQTQSNPIKPNFSNYLLQEKLIPNPINLSRKLFSLQLLTISVI